MSSLPTPTTTVAIGSSAGKAGGARSVAAYAASKAGVMTLAKSIANEYASQGITANALHPGMTNTSFSAEDPSRSMAPIVFVVRPFMRSAKRGAETVVYLASSSAVEGATGSYYANRKAKKSNQTSYDREVTARLWQVSANLVGVADAG